MPVREMLDRMSGPEIVYWAALFKLRAEDRKRAVSEAQQARPRPHSARPKVPFGGVKRGA